MIMMRDLWTEANENHLTTMFKNMYKKKNSSIFCDKVRMFNYGHIKISPNRRNNEKCNEGI